MPSLHKDVKAVVSETRLPSIQQLLSESQLIKQGAEAVRETPTLFRAHPFLQADATPLSNAE